MKESDLKNLALILLIFFCQSCQAVGQTSSNFSIVTENKLASLVISPSEEKVVHIAGEMFAKDVLSISGLNPEINAEIPDKDELVILAGTIGKCKFLDLLIKEKKVDVGQIKGNWESWSIQLVDKPFKGVQKALVIAGSDRRATAYGILELSRMMGVSAWEWWTDVTPEKKEKIVLQIENKTFSSPSVKYRGLFLNDEDWGLQPWAAKTFEPETGDIGPKTYAKIFELMLRLRANTIWPAMHGCTKAFYTIPGNAEVANDYAIVVGTSHCEPMLCNINAEWDSQTMGEWRYDNNAETIINLFEERTKKTATFESIYTIGMRGEHDSPMNAKHLTKQDQINLLEQVIADQREILQKEKGVDANQVPQAFIPYKEVLDYYQNGLEVPEDVTLMWTDDNYGYIRQLSTPEEQKRKGGGGIYYHASYWGRPHDYLWLSSTSPVLIWEEMSKAYATNARDMWILNCGDIKPLEYNIELFMDMAWDISKFEKSSTVKPHFKNWLANKFGAALAEELVDIMWEYYRLSFIRRPEFMAWSQTEPTTKPKQTEMTHYRYGDELTTRVHAWEKLADQVEKIYAEIPASQKDAFYQMVYYPVKGAALMNQKWLYHYKNEFTARQGRTSAKMYGEKAHKAYRDIQDETTYFNTKLQNGKWNEMMSMEPRGLPVFSKPSVAIPAISETSEFGLALEGYETEANDQIPNAYSDVLPVFNAYLNNSYFVDVFLKGEEEISWKAVANAPWIKLSKMEGDLSSRHPEERLWVSIDWDKVPKGENKKEAPLGHDYQMIPPSYKTNSAIDFTSGKKTIRIGVSAFNPKFDELKTYKGFIEGNGYVSINAENYSKVEAGEEANWKVFGGLGYSGEVMAALPWQANSNVDLQTIKEKSPVLEYDFYTFNYGDANIRVQAVPTHPYHSEGRGVRCAVAIDGADPVILDFRTFGRSAEWKQNVLKNAAVKSTKQMINKPGKHTLKVWMVDPGVMIDQVLIDLGGWKDSYAFPAETWCR